MLGAKERAAWGRMAHTNFSGSSIEARWPSRGLFRSTRAPRARSQRRRIGKGTADTMWKLVLHRASGPPPLGNFGAARSISRAMRPGIARINQERAGCVGHSKGGISPAPNIGQARLPRPCHSPPSLGSFEPIPVKGLDLRVIYRPYSRARSVVIRPWYLVTLSKGPSRTRSAITSGSRPRAANSSSSRSDNWSAQIAAALWLAHKLFTSRRNASSQSSSDSGVCASSQKSLIRIPGCGPIVLMSEAYVRYGTWEPCVVPVRWEYNPRACAASSS